MKPRFLLLAVLCLSLLLITSPKVYARELAPVLLLSMDAYSTTIYDVSGFGNDGTLAGSPIEVEGQIGRAIKFDGTNDVATMSHSASLDLGDGGEPCTVMAWLYLEDIETNQHIIAKKTSTFPFLLRIDTDSELIFEMYDGVNNPKVQTTLDSDYLDVWTHVAGIRDPNVENEVRLMVNGAEVDSYAGVGSDCSNSVDVKLGYSDYYFDGIIDEVKIYRMALTDAEVQREMGLPIDVVDHGHATYTYTGTGGKTTGGDVFELYAGGTHGATFLLEDFEYTVGADVPNWLEYEAGGNTIAVSKTIYHSNSYRYRSMHVSDTGAYTCFAERSFTSQTGSFYVQAWIYMDDAGDALGMQLTVEEDDNPGPWVLFYTDNKIYYMDDVDPYSYYVQDWSADTWYNVTLDVDVSTDTYDIYIGGNLKNSSVPFDEAKASINAIRFDTYTGGVPSSETCDGYVDDISIGTDYVGGSTGTATVTVLFEDLQHVHTQFAVGIPEGLEGLEHGLEAYVEWGIDYYVNDAWVTNGWKCRIETDSANIQGASFGVPGNNWIKLKVAWYNRDSGLVKTDYLYTFWEGGPGGLASEETRCDYFRVWLDLWFNSINGSSVVGGRLNSYFYGMHDSANEWFQWLTGSDWGPMIDDVSQSMYFHDLEDGSGNVFPCSQIELMRIRCKVYRSNNYDFRWQLRDFDILSYTFASGDMTGIDTPIFVATKTPDMPQGGFLAALVAGFNAIFKGLSDIFGPALLRFWNAFVGFMDSIFTSLGWTNGFSVILSWIDTLVSWVTQAVLFVISLLATALIFVVEVFGYVYNLFSLLISSLSNMVSWLSWMWDALYPYWGWVPEVIWSLGPVLMIFYVIWLLSPLLDRMDWHGTKQRIEDTVGMIGRIVMFMWMVFERLFDLLYRLGELIPVVE